MKRLLIVDDHPIFRSGLRRALEDQGEFDSVDEAGSVDEAVAFLAKSAVDVVVVDLSLPDKSGLSLIEDWAKKPGSPCFLVLSMSSDRSLVRKAVSLGAAGYSSKNISLESLILGIRLILAGELFIQADLLRDLLTSGLGIGGGRPELYARFRTLTEREKEVLDILLAGESAKAAALSLGVSTRTVENYQSSLYAKLGARSPVDLVRIAIASGFLSSI